MPFFSTTTCSIHPRATSLFPLFAGRNENVVCSVSVWLHTGIGSTPRRATSFSHHFAREKPVSFCLKKHPDSDPLTPIHEKIQVRAQSPPKRASARSPGPFSEILRVLRDRETVAPTTANARRSVANFRPAARPPKPTAVPLRRVTDFPTFCLCHPLL